MARRREIWSLFSGAMGLDLGLEEAGFRPTLAVEIDPECRATIAKNRPQLDLLPDGDLRHATASTLREHRRFDGEVFLMVGGPPCQSFSTAGNRAGLRDPRGNLIYHYLRLIQEVGPRFFVLENVGSLISAALRHRPIAERPGKHWSLKRYGTSKAPTEVGIRPLDPDEQAGSAIRQILRDVREIGYRVNFGVLNAADFGAPQRRYRFIMLGSRRGAPPELPEATHGSDRVPYMTLRDAIWDIRGNPGPHSSYTAEIARIYDLVPQGGNWRTLPRELQLEALGESSFSAGGGKTGFFRRLTWDEPAPTITAKPNRTATALCHPEQTRSLSVRECARLQGFPDDWQFSGSMSSQYMQIGNAVPVRLGRAVGLCLKAHLGKRSHAATVAWEVQLERAQKHLQSSAVNKRGVGNGMSVKLTQQLLPFPGE